MKCILLSFLWLMVSLYFANANWCIQTTTINTRITKILTKTVTSRKFFGGIKRRTVTYLATEVLPRTRQHRVCCDGYILESVHRICEPHCPLGCPRFSGCVKPNSCECQSGYQMASNRCEPICDPTCGDNAFCSDPNICLCKSGFENNDSTKSCMSPTTKPTTVPTTKPTTVPTTKPTTVPTTVPTTEPTRISAKESSMAPEQTTSGNQGRNAHCSYAYNCTTNGLCKLEPYNCECNDGFVKADSSCYLRPGVRHGDCIEENLCKELTTEENRKSTKEIVSSESSETSTTTTARTVPVKPGRNAHCSYAYNCTTNGLCRLEPYNCKCIEGFVKADSSCVSRPGINHDGECIEKSVCEGLTAGGEYTTSATIILSSQSSPENQYKYLTTEEYSKSTEQILSIENFDITTVTSREVASNCESGCINGICINGLCQCPKGSVFSQKSKSCIINSSCDTICHNGICQENGLCECPQGFVYEYNKGCVPYCNQKCIKGICVAPETCKCDEGFKLKSKSSFECMPAGKLSEKLGRNNSNFAWLWVVATIVIIAIIGLLILKKARKRNYNVDKVEKERHIVKFDS